MTERGTFQNPRDGSWCVLDRTEGLEERELGPTHQLTAWHDTEKGALAELTARTATRSRAEAQIPVRDQAWRIRQEYYELPGLILTLPQAQRLFALDPVACKTALAALVVAGFLRRTTSGKYVQSERA